MGRHLDPDGEIQNRIKIARATFYKIQPFLSNDNLHLKLRQQMTECCVWSILLYDIETWTLTVKTTNCREAFDMWLPRRMLGIPWIEHAYHTEVLQRANTDWGMF